MKLTADFETTTDENDCRVWAWAVCEIGNPDFFIWGNTIETFFEYLENSDNSTFYFHNLKFDGEFIFNYLFQNGFTHVERKDKKSKSFTTLISDKGQFYSIEIIFEKNGKKSKHVKIYDSYKIIPFSVEDTAKAFGLPISKLEIDYKENREIGHELTYDEIMYIKNDVSIMAMALHTLFTQGLTKITQGSNALYDYKQTIGERNFERWFPIPYYDKWVREAYKGGFTYLNPKYKNRDIEFGLVMDVNSLYPWVMHDCPLPYGEPIYFEGKYEKDDLYNVYTQLISCQFELKENHIPTIQIKHNLAFVPNQYLTSSEDEIVTMCLTNIDLELFFEHYEVYNLEYHCGWKFKSHIGLFSKYIDKWNKVKMESTLNGNKGMRTLSKLMLNSLYGKYGMSPIVQSKIPYYDDGIVKYYLGEKEERDPIYIPVAVFITSWARHKTITSAQKVYNKFAYADTDSLHIEIDLPEELKKMALDDFEKLTTKDLIKYGVDIPNDFVIDPVALGAWKLESKFTRARFIRQKCYMEDWNEPDTWNNPETYNKDLLNITCAGMPERCYEYVTWENFHEGATYKGKLQPKHVKGGLVLKDIEFTIKPA